MIESPSGPMNPSGPGLSAQRPSEVVVVDDDDEVRALVAEALQFDGYAVRTAGTGAEGVRLMQQHPPDVAIVDLLMPGMDGAEVCAAIRSCGDLDSTRILILSGAEDTRGVAAACNADGAVVKPFTVSLLKHEVRRLLGS